MANDGAPFKFHGGGNYTCCYGIYNCGNHVPDIAKESTKQKRKKGLRPCNQWGACKCFPDKNWTGDGSEECASLKELEKQMELGKINIRRTV